MKRYNFRGTTLGELYAYDSEGYEINDPAEIDDMLYQLGAEHIAYTEDVTVLYVSGMSRMVYYGTDPNPDGYTYMHQVF